MARTALLRAREVKSAPGARRPPTRVLSLEEAVAAYVRPGMHLHFGSHPFRANAALFAVARAFRGHDPQFVLSASGFHSSAHLLGRLRLGRRYVGCFFGDHWPAPRPNALYQRLHDEGAVLENWSLLSYVAALRAGALGEPWAVTGSLLGSDMGAALGDDYREVDIAGDRVALVRAMRPDLAFVHGIVGDADGNVLLAAPRCEGAWAALGARTGVVATVERIVPRGALRGHRDLFPIPAHRVTAICEAPGGARPQPLYVPHQVDAVGYPDQFEWYAEWRRLAMDDAAFAAFTTTVLDAPDPTAALAAWPAPAAPVPTAAPDAFVRLAAEQIAARVRAGGYPVVLAGIGQSFQAARLAKASLAAEGVDVRLVVEIGLYDLDPAAGDYLLAHAHLSRAARLTDVEDALGAVTCGPDARCLGVLGAAQVDRAGNLNSTRVGGRLLVGSGGANDIASRAAEVVVLAPVDRLVPRVDFVTSPGRAVRSIVTEAGVLTRDGADWIGPPAALARFQEP